MYIAVKGKIARRPFTDAQLDIYFNEGYDIIQRAEDEADVLIASNGVWLTEKPVIEEQHEFNFTAIMQHSEQQ